MQVTTSNDRLAFVAPSMRGGGMERVMLELAIGFSEMGYTVDLVLVNAEGPYLQFVPETVRIVNLASSRTYKSLPAFIRYLRRERPAAILSTIGNVNVMVVLAKIFSKVPVRIVVREPITPSSRFGSVNTPKQAFYWHLKRKSYLYADKIVAVSAGVGNDIHHFLKIPKENIAVIYNPVDDAKIQASAQERIDHQWYAADSPPVIVAVGRLSVQKDFGTLLHAFSIVRKQVDAKLLILGEGEERPRLEVLVRELGLEDHVKMPGFVINPFPYIAKARTMALSSLYEGLPNVLIQSLVLGTPVVSTDCESGPREILDDGKYGRLVKVGDPATLAAQLVASVKMESTPEDTGRLIERGRSFSVKRALEEYHKVLIASPYQDALRRPLTP